MNIVKNFLNSGYTFSEDEYELQSKYILFNSVLGISIVIVSIMIVMQAMHSDFLLVFLNSVQVGIITVGIFLLRQSRMYFDIILYITFSLITILLFITIYSYPNDYMRMVWLLVLIIITFLLRGSRLGYPVAFFSMLTLLLIFYLHHDHIVAKKPYLLMFGFIILITILVRLYDNREKYAKERLKVLNSHLEERIVNETKKRVELYKKSTERLKKVAHYDSLTELPNRILLFDQLKQAIKKSKRNKKKIAILFLDIDNFKEINDSYGHIFGDMILKAFSKRLRASIRESDLLGRFGGDEFIVVAEDIRDISAIVSIAQSINQNIQIPVEVEKKEFYITTSIGIAVYPEDGFDADTLIKNADVAMYDAKKNGRNQIALYTRRMTEYVQHRLMVDQEIRSGIQNNEFAVHYQPIVDNQDSSLAGFEALVRWNHPERGLMLPDDFIPIAEMSSHIIGIGERVLQQISRQIILWHQQGFDPPFIAVNVSPKQLRSPELTALLKRTLDSVPFRRDWLEVEITEGYAIQNLEDAISKLHEIKALGISLSLDDFGTGYSSLSYLKKLPVDKLKIDRSFVRDILEDNEDRILVNTIVSLSREMKLKIVAEGVENVEQFTLLQQMGCTFSQGYYFGKPMSSSLIEEHYIKSKRRINE